MDLSTKRTISVEFGEIQDISSRVGISLKQRGGVGGDERSRRKEWRQEWETIVENLANHSENLRPVYWPFITLKCLKNIAHAPNIWLFSPPSRDYAPLFPSKSRYLPQGCRNKYRRTLLIISRDVCTRMVTVSPHFLGQNTSVETTDPSVDWWLSGFNTTITQACHTSVSRVQIPVGSKTRQTFTQQMKLWGSRTCGDSVTSQQCSILLTLGTKAAAVGKGEGLFLFSDETSRTHDAFVWLFCWDHRAISQLMAQWFQQQVNATVHSHAICF